MKFGFKKLFVVSSLSAFCLLTVTAFAQTAPLPPDPTTDPNARHSCVPGQACDPGVRGGTDSTTLGVGRPLPPSPTVDPAVDPVTGVPGNQITPLELQFFNEGKFRSIELEATSDGSPDVFAGTDCKEVNNSCAPNFSGYPGSFTAGCAPGDHKSVQDNIPNKGHSSCFNSAGLGARFNGDTCMGCHVQPVLGGSSPRNHNGDASPGATVNPAVGSFGFAKRRHPATNDPNPQTIPFFITEGGPIVEARFVSNPDGTPDGGVKNLFTVKGRQDAQAGFVGTLGLKNPNFNGPVNFTCDNINQPDFNAAHQQGNLGLRLPLQLFGLGLIDELTDKQLSDAVTASALAGDRAGLGIAGHFNLSGNDGTINHGGWKAQNKGVEMFSGEAYNVEVGVTNDLFHTPRQLTPDEDLTHCEDNNFPNDVTREFKPEFLNSFTVEADWTTFPHFIRFLAAPTPFTTTASQQHGRTLFESTTSTGCALCHLKHGTFVTKTCQNDAKPGLITGDGNQCASNKVLEGQPVDMFSDMQVHNMGEGLEDKIAQGSATGEEFRTTPLWGIGQRIFFLHDGRAPDLLTAIQLHSSTGSEANAVIGKFNALSVSDQQDILNFLRSL